jgi:wyosine [tRNA(Phe)-imidazoG37] synthetase (radical SAM superfamily)
MTDEPTGTFFSDHRRRFGENKYVYPVVSRRSRGISIGINLSPDQICSFSCIYCQVAAMGKRVVLTPDSAPVDFTPIDMGILKEELEAVVEEYRNGKLFEWLRFRDLPEPLRRLNDIAFSGNGEPTLVPDFLDAVKVAAEVHRTHDLDDTKIVLITNSSGLDRPPVVEALEVLDKNNGEIWAKLDAGSEAYFQTVSQTVIPFEDIISNLIMTSRLRPIVIQTLFMIIAGNPVMDREVDAYCDRLSEIVDAGGQISLIQLHTVARAPAENMVEPLSPEQLAFIAERVRSKTGLNVEVY